MPQPGEGTLGGHAVCMVGYDKSERVFIMRNSWGVKWGDQVGVEVCVEQSAELIRVAFHSLTQKYVLIDTAVAPGTESSFL
jgi:hypothetical protein